MIIGLLCEGKIPTDNRVALTPLQCKWLREKFPSVTVIVESSASRCYSDAEYERAGIPVVSSLEQADLIFGIKEVPVSKLIYGKTYIFFSHTRKKQPYNQHMLQMIVRRGITLIDYECMEHSDGQRIIGFGFFAGIVGAHNGMMAYGERTGLFELERVYKLKDFKELIHTYFGLRVPPVKIAVTGSGRVAHGILEIMNLMEIIEVEKEEYLARNFDYPVYVQLKGADLYAHNISGGYNRDDFHQNPSDYRCLFSRYVPHTDILMNGIFWDTNIPRLFELSDVTKPDFRIQVIADVTDDSNGSVPINLGDQTIEFPVYGVDRDSYQKTEKGLPNSIDVVAVGNLPNELPRDASKYFGEQLLKYIIPDMVAHGSRVIENATIVKKGQLTNRFEYLTDYVNGIL